MRSSPVEQSEVGQCAAQVRSGFTIVVVDDDDVYDSVWGYQIQIQI
jgi:hypothetical protein